MDKQNLNTNNITFQNVPYDISPPSFPIPCCSSYPTQYISTVFFFYQSVCDFTCLLGGHRDITSVYKLNSPLRNSCLKAQVDKIHLLSFWSSDSCLRYSNGTGPVELPAETYGPHWSVIHSLSIMWTCSVHLVACDDFFNLWTTFYW